MFTNRPPINITTYEPECGTKNLQKKWIAELGLLESDRNVLLDPVGCINDSLINASQKLLKSQFASLNGLQDTVLGYVMSFEIQSGEFLQILHTVGNHWLLVSSINMQHPNVKVFDSLYDSVPEMAKAQIASLLCTQEDKIEVTLMDVQ